MLNNLDPQTRKTVSLLGVLVVVAILSVIVLYFTSSSDDETAELQTPRVQQINTTFNRAPLEEVQRTHNDRPSLGGSLGNPNPFSDYE